MCLQYWMQLTIQGHQVPLNLLGYKILTCGRMLDPRKILIWSLTKELLKKSALCHHIWKMYHIQPVNTNTCQFLLCTSLKETKKRTLLQLRTRLQYIAPWLISNRKHSTKLQLQTDAGNLGLFLIRRSMLLTSCNVRNDKPYFATVIGFNQAHGSDHKMASLLDINKPSTYTCRMRMKSESVHAPHCALQCHPLTRLKICCSCKGDMPCLLGDWWICMLRLHQTVEESQLNLQ